MSLERLITEQHSSRLFNCDIAMSKIFKCRPFKNRTMRYATTCVLGGNVAFGQNFIPNVDTCQSAVKSLLRVITSSNRVLLLSKHQSAARFNDSVLAVGIRFLFYNFAISIEFCYSLTVFPGEAQVFPGIIVEICRLKPEKKRKKRKIDKHNSLKYI